MKITPLILIASILSIASCSPRQPQQCTGGESHKWGLWEVTETPENYYDSVLVQKRSCAVCGFTERESSNPK